MTKLQGGYLTLKTDAVKSTEFANAHTSSLDVPLKGAHLEALNHIQKTRWRINRDVLNVALRCKARGLDVAGFPCSDELALPEYPEHLDKKSDEFKAHIRERERIHTENARNAGMRLKLWGMLQMAEELADFPALWFPHYADFRGRFYRHLQFAKDRCEPGPTRDVLDILANTPLREGVTCLLVQAFELVASTLL